jgi:GNAT superfamily N-acetyltransferase
MAERVKLVAVELTSSDGDALQHLFESDPSYFEQVLGYPPGAEAQSAYSALPEGSDYDDKFLIGVWARRTELGGSMEGLVAIMDLIRDHPVPRSWTLGLIFVHPSSRRRRVGTALMGSCAAWLANKGVSILRLGVVEENSEVLPFFEQLGFELLQQRSGVTSGLRTTSLSVLQESPARVASAAARVGPIDVDWTID